MNMQLVRCIIKDKESHRQSRDTVVAFNGYECQNADRKVVGSNPRGINWFLVFNAKSSTKYESHTRVSKQSGGAKSCPYGLLI